VPIIAKTASEATVALEAMIYQDVLPLLSFDSLRCYGTERTDDPARSWLFLEDVVGREYDEGSVADRLLAARWLAELHVVAIRLGLQDKVPEAGTQRLAECLAEALQNIDRSLGEGAPDEGDTGLISLQSLLIGLAAAWSQVEEVCALLPAGLVHGDFKDENVRIHSVGSSNRVRVIDWEYSGWGPLCTDLFAIVDEYGSRASQDLWPDYDPQLVGRVAIAFRMLSCINWAAQTLPYPPYNNVRDDLRFYAASLRSTCAALGWVS
jgi:hypothetical protein